MSVIQICQDFKDTLDLFRHQSLYLKPISRMNISVQLPQLKKSGAKISNWEVMEKVKEMAKPFHFPVFKVVKSSLEFIRFEAEIENYGWMDQVLAKIDMKTIKLSGFQELLKVRAAESRPPFPTRQEWDSYFRENRAMNEMKAGERPDTVYIKNLPCQWFLNSQDKSGMAKDKPSEYVLKKVFATFGEIRAVDIPMLDPYREKMKSTISGIQIFTFGQDLVFDAYIQYKEYIGFVKAMNSLKGMKLLFKDRFEERAWVANIVVDFDRTKHLAESTIKRRALEREKLAQKERELEETERRKEELRELKRSDELRRMEKEEREEAERKAALKGVKEKRRMEREERRRQRKLEQKLHYNEEEVAEKIALEERKLLIAQRKLESIRLLDELLDRVKAMKHRENDVKNLEKDLLRTAAKEAKGTFAKAATILSTSFKDQDEKALRDKLVQRLKQKELNRMEHFGDRLRRTQGLVSNSDSSSDGLEDISDEENVEEMKSNEDSDDEKEDIDGDEELALTSTDEEEFEKKERLRRQRKKEKKKDRKRKEKEESKRRRKEIESHVKVAQNIADRDKRSRSREKRHSNSRDDESRHGSRRRQAHMDEEQTVSSYREIRAEERLRKRLEEKAAAKQAEQAKEELYDQMVNPHLYGEGRSGHRRLKPGEHYEDVQKKELEEQIRIRERLERDKRRQQQRQQQQQQSIQRRDPRHYDHQSLNRSRSRENHHGSRRYERESQSRNREYRAPRNEARSHDNPRYRTHDSREDYPSRTYPDARSESGHRRMRR
ncbi:hypothetical protein TCAL_00520 [Tigriopus californicus]|uniref:RRM domain-containing protein n=1 Tax=Tigriopus californicus TaxID=6832 RepID=A0A553PD30_TIGCA|nr:A-kinase anchor protein 17A-like [Tigriopus californicus]TRY75592.1 hypothetical protein TCAL_00520 [Tigriopus californicus]